MTKTYNIANGCVPIDSLAPIVLKDNNGTPINTLNMYAIEYLPRKDVSYFGYNKTSKN